MDYNLLPNTDIKVSKICLGTMTFGKQNTEAEGHEQMDYAFEQGVNFFDTAELYPVPADQYTHCLLYTSPSPRDRTRSRMPSSA